MIERKVLVSIEVKDDRHCSNDCTHITGWRIESGFAAECRLFKIALKWDKRCTYHGYLRCACCIGAEV